MRSFGIVPEKPRNQFFVELFRFGQELFVIVDKLFLKGSVEPLHVGIHLGCLGVGVPMIFV